MQSQGLGFPCRRGWNGPRRGEGAGPDPLPRPRHAMRCVPGKEYDHRHSDSLLQGQCLKRADNWDLPFGSTPRLGKKSFCRWGGPGKGDTVSTKHCLHLLSGYYVQSDLLTLNLIFICSQGRYFLSMLIPMDMQLIKTQSMLDFRTLVLNGPQSRENAQREAAHGFGKEDN